MISPSLVPKASFNGQYSCSINRRYRIATYLFLRESQATFLIKNKTLHKIEQSEQVLNPYSQELLKFKKGGIVFFFNWDYWKPKAILHSLEKF